MNWRTFLSYAGNKNGCSRIFDVPNSTKGPYSTLVPTVAREIYGMYWMLARKRPVSTGYACFASVCVLMPAFWTALFHCSRMRSTLWRKAASACATPRTVKLIYGIPALWYSAQYISSNTFASWTFLTDSTQYLRLLYKTCDFGVTPSPLA